MCIWTAPCHAGRCFLSVPFWRRTDSDVFTVSAFQTVPTVQCVRVRQAARGALLRLLARLVAQGVLATVCLRRLVACLAPPPAPPAAGERNEGPWQPAAAELAVQDEVVSALTQVCFGGHVKDMQESAMSLHTYTLPQLQPYVLIQVSNCTFVCMHLPADQSVGWRHTTAVMWPYEEGIVC